MSNFSRQKESASKVWLLVPKTNHCSVKIWILIPHWRAKLPEDPSLQKTESSSLRWGQNRTGDQLGLPRVETWFTEGRFSTSAQFVLNLRPELFSWQFLPSLSWVWHWTFIFRIKKITRLKFSCLVWIACIDQQNTIIPGVSHLGKS